MEVAGTYTEQLAHVVGQPLLPLITRRESGLCIHCRAIQRWVKRKRLWELLVSREMRERERLERVLHELHERKRSA